jgi:hypothetical protein
MLGAIMFISKTRRLAIPVVISLLTLAGCHRGTAQGEAGSGDHPAGANAAGAGAAGATGAAGASGV